jgi:hypothetical protein
MRAPWQQHSDASVPPCVGNAMKRSQFTIRELLLATAIAGLSIGWWLDHRDLNAKLRHSQDFELGQQLKINDLRQDVAELRRK